MLTLVAKVMELILPLLGLSFTNIFRLPLCFLLALLRLLTLLLL